MGISFTIPINYVKEIVNQIKDFGIVSRGWLGVSVQEVTKDLAGRFFWLRYTSRSFNWQCFKRLSCRKGWFTKWRCDSRF